jgi:peroxiredoxin
VLAAGDPVPAEARVWTAPGEAATSVGAVIAGELRSLLCFYPYDWSPVCRNELRLLRERRDDLAAAEISPYGISLDSPWSHRAWAEALGLGDGVPLLSDALHEAARGFGVLREDADPPAAHRSVFLVSAGVVRAAWLLGDELPDVDVILGAARDEGERCRGQKSGP